MIKKKEENSLPIQLSGRSLLPIQDEGGGGVMEMGGAKVGGAPKPLRVGFLSSSLAIL